MSDRAKIVMGIIIFALAALGFWFGITNIWKLWM